MGQSVRCACVKRDSIWEEMSLRRSQDPSVGNKWRHSQSTVGTSIELSVKGVLSGFIDLLRLQCYRLGALITALIASIEKIETAGLRRSVEGCLPNGLLWARAKMETTCTGCIARETRAKDSPIASSCRSDVHISSNRFARKRERGQRSERAHPHNRCCLLNTRKRMAGVKRRSKGGDQKGRAEGATGSQVDVDKERGV